MDIIGGDSSGANVKDSTDQEFVADVIEPSNDVPVIVDFWAPWCGPCKTLGPIIEKAVGARNGKVKLVKVNIDENPGVAGQLGVRSIPAVFAFDKGRPVDGFMGALPEGQINSFIDKLLSGTDAGQQIEELLAQAQQLFQAGDIGAAAQTYAAIVREDETSVEAIAGLARCYLANDDPERASQTIAMIPEVQRGHPDVKGVLTALELASNAAEPDELADMIAAVDADPENDQLRYDLAEKMAAGGRHEDAAEHLFKILEKDLTWNDGAAKAQLLTVFEAAGEKSDVTRKGRRRLSGLIFA